MPFEPITALTDYAIALESFLFSLVLLSDRQRRQNLAVWGWAIAFLGVAIAAIIGGILHFNSLGWAWQAVQAWWLGLAMTLGLTSFAMLAATIWSELAGRSRWFGLLLAGLKLGLHLSPYLVLIGQILIGQAALVRLEFWAVAVDYLSAMVGMAILQGRSLWLGRRESRHSVWCLAGIFVSGIASAIQGSGVRVLQVINHNDLYHLVQMIALYCLYRSALLLRIVKKET